MGKKGTDTSKLLPAHPWVWKLVLMYVRVVAHDENCMYVREHGKRMQLSPMYLGSIIPEIWMSVWSAVAESLYMGGKGFTTKLSSCTLHHGNLSSWSSVTKNVIYGREDEEREGSKCFYYSVWHLVCFMRASEGCLASASHIPHAVLDWRHAGRH